MSDILLMTVREMQYTATRAQTANSASTPMTTSRKYWYQAEPSTAGTHVRRSLVSDHVLRPVHGLLEWCEWLVQEDTG